MTHVAFPFHFAEPPDLSPSPFALRPDHLFADALGEIDLSGVLTDETLESVVADVPSEWAPDPSIYVTYLRRRLGR